MFDVRKIRLNDLDEIVNAKKLKFADWKVLNAVENVQDVGVAEFNGRNSLK